MRLKSYVSYIILLISILILPVKALELDIFSENAILYNLDENTILYEKNSEEIVSIASLTKIMTAVITLENINSLTDTITLTSEDFKGLAEANASVAGFIIGETVSYKDLLYGLMLPSGADAALALTRTVAGSKEHFIELMNEKAKELGLENTHFVNETGLDADGHYSTVKNVATLFQYALENEDFLNIIKSDSYTTANGRLTFKSTIKKFQDKYSLTMDYLIGGKTGTTAKAGLALATIAYQNGTNYLLVTVKAPNNWKEPYHLYDAKKIYDYFIENYQKQVLLKVGDPLLELETAYAKEEKVTFYSKQKIEKYLPKDYQKEELKIEYDGIKRITPDMKENTYLGTITIKYQEKIIGTEEIYLNKQIKLDIKKVIQKYQTHFIIIGVLLLAILCGILRILRRNYKKKLN